MSDIDNKDVKQGNSMETLPAVQIIKIESFESPISSENLPPSSGTSSGTNLNLLNTAELPTDNQAVPAPFSILESGGEQFVVVNSESSSFTLGDSFSTAQAITFNVDSNGQLILQSSGDKTGEVLDHQLIRVEESDGSSADSQGISLDIIQALQSELGLQLPPLVEGVGQTTQIFKQTSKDETKVAETSTNQTDTSLSAKDKPIEQVDESQNPPKETTNRKRGDDIDCDLSSTWTPSSRDEKPTKPKPKKFVQAKPELADTDNPIPLTEETVVMINGKKCILGLGADGKQVCAFPIKQDSVKKKRGRPRLTEEQKAEKREKLMKEIHENGSTDKPDCAQEDEKDSSKDTNPTELTAETELTNTESDGVRRSYRKRKKAKLLEDYEELKDSDGEREETKDNTVKDPSISHSVLETARKKSDSSTQPVKRGRGRPRRYPPANQPPPPQVPAFLIPQANGQTLVMAPFQDLPGIQSGPRQLQSIVPKPSTGMHSTDLTSVPVSSENLNMDNSVVLEGNNIMAAIRTESLTNNDSTNTEDNTESLQRSTVLEVPLPDSSKDVTSGTDHLTSKTTVIQIPDNMLPMLNLKRDPVKIGLKASEQDLEKLKCPKCDFQGYYNEQYRNHIATHGDDVQKCKCCSYVSLDADELLAHFKENHPRCICPDCGFMAEHAYLIKRHQMRHNVESCTCKICGKVYKDLYILRMHVKMVHMPAEVLFECNVCSKKFTRKAHLKRHLRIHEPEKPFKCPHCDYRGCERSDITKHMLIHEEPKHVCERCGKTFRHIKNKELHVKRHFGQRDYKCGVCNFFGYTYTDIRKHIERKHQDIKALICERCNKPFRTEYGLKEHLQTCNMMMIEQVLAIPTSAGGTNQATIRIPTNIGPNGQILLDNGQTISINGQTLSLDKHGGLMVAEEQLTLPGAVTEDEEEMEEDENSLSQTMQVNAGEEDDEIRIIVKDSLSDTTQVMSASELRVPVQILEADGQIKELDSTQLVDGSSMVVSSVQSQDAKVVDAGEEEIMKMLEFKEEIHDKHRVIQTDS